MTDVQATTDPQQRKDRLNAIELARASGLLQRHSNHLATTTVLVEARIGPHQSGPVHLYIQDDIHGANRTIEIQPNDEFIRAFPELSEDYRQVAPEDRLHTRTTTEFVLFHQTAEKIAQYRFHNYSDQDVVIQAGTTFGSAIGHRAPDIQSFYLQHHEDYVIALLDDSANEILLDPLDPDEIPAYHAQNPPKDPNAKATAGFEGLGPVTLDFDYRPYEELPFDRGGKPRTLADLEELGLDLSQCVDASKPGCPPITPEEKRHLVALCIEMGAVWARNSKVPTPARHPLARCEIHTGDAQPIKQKPYPIPQIYQEAVRKEVEGLLKAGLIEPGFGNWASPVLCIVKKDSTPDNIKLKIAVDFRRLNAVTLIDCGLLGDQSDILEMFHGKPHMSLADAAGGFYQFLIPEEHRDLTGFVLPTSCGGTLFRWKVAPYGLTNMPAIYSRAMQHVTSGLTEVDLGYMTTEEGFVSDPESDYLGTGSAPTWVDDITMASGGGSSERGIYGHCELLRRVFRRLIVAGMTLKPSKTHLLRAILEVLGFDVTPEGLKPQEAKVQAIRDMPTSFSTPTEVLRFLGMVNFYRRFIPALNHTANPLYGLLRGLSSKDTKAPRPGKKQVKVEWTDV